MAPLEVFIDSKNINILEVQRGKIISKEIPKRLTLEAGDSLRVHARDAMIQVRCDRKDMGGKISVRKIGDRIGIPNVDIGFMHLDTPNRKEIHATAGASIKKGSSAQLMIDGEVLISVKHKPNQ